MKYLFIGAHVDDVELCCGGTIALLLEQGHEVTVVVFSHKYAFGNLFREWQASMLCLHPTLSYCHDFDTRRFSNHRQDILDSLISIKANPDLVFTHDPDDRHQDHAVIGQESLRAFKHCNVVTYTGEWNRLRGHNTYYVPLKKVHIETKLRALSCYESQKDRPYMRPDFIYGQAVTNGVACGVEYAEGFEVKRLVYVAQRN